MLKKKHSKASVHSIRFWGVFHVMPVIEHRLTLAQKTKIWHYAQAKPFTTLTRYAYESSLPF